MFTYTRLQTYVRLYVCVYYIILILYIRKRNNMFVSLVLAENVKIVLSENFPQSYRQCVCNNIYTYCVRDVCAANRCVFFTRKQQARLTTYASCVREKRCVRQPPASLLRTRVRREKRKHVTTARTHRQKKKLIRNTTCTLLRV